MSDVSMPVLALSFAVFVLIFLVYHKEKRIEELERGIEDLHKKIIDQNGLIFDLMAKIEAYKAELLQSIDLVSDSVDRLNEWYDIKLMNLRKTITSGGDMKKGGKKPTKKVTPKKK